jgi:hypothetical protein
VALHHSQRWGPDAIGAQLGVSARTVSRVLARHRLPHLRVCDPMTGDLIRASTCTAVRYERGRPGELVSSADSSRARKKIAVGSQIPWRTAMSLPWCLQNSHQNGGPPFLIFVADPTTVRVCTNRFGTQAGPKWD